MPPLTRPCPRCASPLAIPQPPPERLTCPSCQAAHNLRPSAGKAAAAAAAPVEAFQAVPGPAAAPSGGRAGRVLLLGGASVVLVAGLTAAVVLLTRDAPPNDTPSDSGLVALQPPKTRPPDPRIKIVQPAVDRGVAFLKAKVPLLAPTLNTRGHHEIPDSAWVAGVAGLIGLTLLECGVPADDPAVLRVAEIVRAEAPKMDKIYTLSTSLFFLNRWAESRPLTATDGKLAQTFALRIIAGQLSRGVWWYEGVILPPEGEAKLLASLKDGRYRPTRSRPYSLSNTQFAMLALWGARKHGVPVREPLLAAANHFHASQFPDGHWIYGDTQAVPISATSTCAGLMSLAMEKVLREDKEFAAARPQTDRPKKTADVTKAFAYVAASIGRKAGDPGGAAPQYAGTLFQADAVGDLYFLWSLERLAVIYGKPRIGGKDWYDWGYPLVLKAQRADGSWQDWSGPLPDTCFALLFLKRANIAKDLTDKLRELSREPALSRAPAAPGAPRVRES